MDLKEGKRGMSSGMFGMQTIQIQCDQVTDLFFTSEQYFYKESVIRAFSLGFTITFKIVAMLYIE